MSLRIIIKPAQISQWISSRNGTPARRRGTETDLRIVFGETPAEFEPLPVEDLLETMKFKNLVLLVDQEPGKTQHEFIQHS